MPHLYMDGLKESVQNYGSKALAESVSFKVAEMGDLQLPLVLRLIHWQINTWID